jgi:hypothetical protein
MKVENIQRK